MNEQIAHPENTKDASHTDAKAFLRVNVGLLDTLMNLAGELVLGSN